MDAMVREERKEDKYIITKDQYTSLLAEVKKHLKPFKYDESPSSEYTVVRSVYMDSPDLVNFQRHVNKDDNRSKIRLRTYAPEGDLSYEFFVEIKEKRDGEDVKSRFQIDRGNYSEVLKGKDISVTPALKTLNNDIEAVALKLMVNRLNTMIKGYNMRPSIVVKYNRCAFGTDSLRLTFDEGLEVTNHGRITPEMAQKARDRSDWDQAEKVSDKFDPDKHVIFEIKHKDNIPVWLSKYLDANKIEQQSFSKYAKGCYEVIKSLL